MWYRIWSLLLLFIVQKSIAQPLPPLIPYNDGKKWGYADTNGKVKISPGWRQVEFFKGNSAKVTIDNNHFCLIDTSGAYIIPPPRHWNGHWAGPEKTPLNSRDNNGLYGLIDTNNWVLIPFEWDGPGEQLPEGYSGSFKLVKKGDRYGVIGKDNRLIIPCNYISIRGRGDLLPIQGFLITDPDNTAGANGQGLINSNGTLILPPKYSSIQMIISGTDTLLDCKLSLDNEVGERTVNKWFRYISGKSAQPFDKKNYTIVQPEPRGKPEQVLENGLVRFWTNRGEGLLSTGRDTIVAPGTYYAINGDTLITKTESRSSRDSVLIDIQYRKTTTLKPLRHSRTVWINQPAEGKDINFNYSHNYEADRSRQIDWGPVSFDIFYKDSFQFHVVNKTGNLPGAEIFIVSGSAIVSDTRQTYFAVVDRELDYLVKPLPVTIYHYNRQDDIVTISGYDRATGQAGFGMQTAAGEVLMPLQCNNIYEGLRWNGKIFGLASWEPQLPKQEATVTYSHHQMYYRPEQHFKIVDQTGALLPVTKKYYFSYVTWNQYRPGFPRYSLYTVDGYIYPDGSPVFAKVKAGNATLNYAAQDWFTVMRNNQRVLIDTNNKEVLPGFAFDNIQMVFADNTVAYGGNYDPYSRQFFQGTGRLYLVSFHNKQGVPFQCYLDDRRRLYGDKDFFQTATQAQKK